MNKVQKIDIKLLIIIAFIVTAVLSTTYALLNFSIEETTASTQAGCVDVDYTGTVLTTSSLVSTTDYTEGAHATVTLSKKNASCYNKATIHLHTDETNTAPLNGVKALKYKVMLGNVEVGSGVVKDNSTSDSAPTDFTIDLTTVELTTTPTTYDVYIWIDSNVSMGTYDGKTFSGYIYASSEQTSTIRPVSYDFVETVLAPNANSDASIDFSKTSQETNTNGIYYIDETINDENPIYYYRGNVNNNLLFADTCWKIVRTTETGGLKLIYNGTPTNGTCNNTGTASQIGTKAFNSSYNSPAYVGYMYGTPYTHSSKSMSSDTTAYVYGNDITYSGGTYTLSSTISSSDWLSTYISSDLNSNHYTCFTTGTTCTSVYYIYYTDSSTAYYITLTGGKTVEDALSEMLDYNTTSSTIKGNSTTTGTLDYWYYNNIEQAGYSDYIEDTVWCNDRSISNLNGWDPDGGSTGDYLYFSGYNRATAYQPSLMCSREIDSFTVSEDNGNGDLDYPVGLLTADEIMLAGGKHNTSNSSYYLCTGTGYWTGSPYRLYGNVAIEFLFYFSGDLSYFDVNSTRGVRPSISLKAGYGIIEGDGTTSSPYVVDTSTPPETDNTQNLKIVSFYNGSTPIGTQEVEDRTNTTLKNFSSLNGTIPSDYTGWSFAGWTTSATDTKIEYKDKSVINTTEDIELYAVYSRTLNINYNANGGTGNINSIDKTIYVNSTSTETTSQNVTLANNTFTKAGHTFSKWTEGSTSGTEYEEGAKYNPNLEYNASDFGITMYAKWTADTYTISYDANGGTNAPTNQTKTYGIELNLSSDKPTRSGYAFLGWSTSSTATTPTYESGAIYDINEPITLYAVWELTNFRDGVLAVNATSDASINFNDENVTNGIYYIDETINDTNPIYYYRGNVNNNLLFADTCWKIIRTTETGGLKLIYNGTPTNGTCNNTGTASQIGTKAFNENNNSPAYAGYMYGTPYTYSSKSMSSDTTNYVYGNTVTYTGGTYTLSGTTSSSSWSSIYNGGLNSNHYTCWTDGTTCTSVYYIYYTDSSTAYYITLTAGKNVEDALSEMLDNNTTSSTIKGNKVTEGTLDNWYYNNIRQAGYSNYVEDTIWCDDRSISSLNGWNPNGGNTRDYLYFSGTNRTYTTYEPSLTCNREIDRFTVSETNGNGALDYPVGLLTVDEIVLAGGSTSSYNASHFLNTGEPYWIGTAYDFHNNVALEYWMGASDLSNYNVGRVLGVRPSISLAEGFEISGGDGTTSSPYVVDASAIDDTITYTINYNANGGNGGPNSQTKNYGERLTLSSATPTREGYTFLGWSTSSTATTPTYEAGGIYNINVDATLYAVWVNIDTTPFIRDVMAVNATSDASIDFSVDSNTSGTNGIYYIDETENDPNPIYYYRGNVNNNLLFADTCWKIVRTTETGGLKLIYNGTPSNGTCNNTENNTIIGVNTFNSNNDSLAYVGYMYGTTYTRSSKTMSSDSTAYKYGNTVTYSGGTYTLGSTISSSSWSSIYNGGLNNNHYTCFTTGTTCTSVYYIYYTNDSTAHYITLTDGKKVEDAIEDMLNNNTTSSTIKGNSTTEGTIDYWYYNNIEQTGYSNYIEDTIWCNERTIKTLNGWDPNGGSTTLYLYFSGRNRSEPTLTCPREIDRFTVSNSKGNGDLDYPVGLLTSDEVMLAGGNNGTTNKNYYLYSNMPYWIGTPYDYTNNGAIETRFYATGYLDPWNVTSNSYIRPSIALKAGFEISGGDGTTGSPYVVDTTSNPGGDDTETITYTISYNANGGSGTTASSSHTSNVAKNLTTNSYTRTGYTFAGWSTSADGTVVYTDGQSVTNLSTTNGATVTLYAQWTINTGLVYYYPNGGSALSSYPLLDSSYGDGSFAGASSAIHSINYDTAKTLNLNNVTNIFSKTGYGVNSATAWIVGSPTSTTYLTQETADLSSYLANETNVVIKVYANWVDNIAPTAPTYTAAYASGGASYTSGNIATKTVRTTISSTDAGSGVSYMQYSYDKSTWNTLQFSAGSLTKSGTTWTGVEPWGFSYGRNNTAYFRACDVAGNCSGVSTGFNIRYASQASASAKTGLKFTGASQTGVTGSNVTWSGTQSATNPGTYSATATAKSGYVFSEGVTTKAVSWSIAGYTFAVGNSFSMSSAGSGYFANSKQACSNGTKSNTFYSSSGYYATISKFYTSAGTANTSSHSYSEANTYAIYVTKVLNSSGSSVYGSGYFRLDQVIKK